jgi:hypothetical protein
MDGLFPRTYTPPSWYQQCHYFVVYNWLNIEIELNAEQRLPALRQIVGHRNREVYHYVQQLMDFKDRELCLRIYGAFEIKNERLPR